MSKCFGAEVTGHFGTNFVVPKCLVVEVSGSLRYGSHAVADASLCVC